MMTWLALYVAIGLGLFWWFWERFESVYKHRFRQDPKAIHTIFAVTMWSFCWGPVYMKTAVVAIWRAAVRVVHARRARILNAQMLRLMPEHGLDPTNQSHCTLTSLVLGSAMISTGTVKPDTAFMTQACRVASDLVKRQQEAQLTDQETSKQAAPTTESHEIH